MFFACSLFCHKAHQITCTFNHHHPHVFNCLWLARATTVELPVKLGQNHQGQNSTIKSVLSKNSFAQHKNNTYNMQPSKSVLCVCIQLSVYLVFLCIKYHVTSHTTPPYSLPPEVIQTGPLVHTSIINKTNTPHRIAGKLNTISCFCWNFCTRLVGSIISLHIVVPVKLKCIKT